MSHFLYKHQKRSCRTGVWLRVSSLPDDTLSKILSMVDDTRESHPWQVKVLEVNNKTNQVLLEVWCEHKRKPDAPRKHSVFHVWADENPDWVCEGDLGRGYKGR